MRLFVLARHGQSELNARGVINGDPDVPVALSEEGEHEAAQLGEEVANIPLDLCVHTRFGRTAATAEIVLRGRDAPLVCEPLLDDVDVGELEGETIVDYPAWKREHRSSDPFPGGESLDDAAQRYAEGFRRLLARPESSVLAICHEIPVRYAVNAAAGSNQLDGPTHNIRNAAPYLFSADALERAASRIDELASR